MDGKPDNGSAEGDAAEALKRRLRADLVSAIKQKQSTPVAALRAMIAALDNAQAVPPEDRHAPYEPHDFADGSAEVSRLKLSRADVAQLVANEVASRHAAAAQMKQHGKPELAERLLCEAAVLQTYESGASPPP
jgi:uncharacterized protein YqeY